MITRQHKPRAALGGLLPAAIAAAGLAFAPPAFAEELEIVTPSELPPAITGEWYSEYLQASGGVEPYTWSVGDGWPSEIASAGYVSWYADWGYDAPGIQFSASDEQVGTYSFPVKVTDSEGTVAEKTFTVLVEENPNHQPVLTHVSPSEYDVYVGPGETVFFSIDAIDPDGDELSFYGEWDISENGNWEWQGSFYENTFTLSDLAQIDGYYYVSIQASDGSRSASRWWYVHVGDYLVVSGDSMPEGAIGMPYEFALTARRTMGEFGALSWSASNLPGGMSIDSATGVISGAPEESGDFAVQVYAYDSDNQMQGYKTLAFHVDSGAPRILAASPEEGGVNLSGLECQEFAVAADSSIGAALSYEWTLDGEVVGTDSTCLYERDASDVAMHSLRCEVFAEGFDEPDAVEWTLGVLEVADPVGATVQIGGTARLAISVTSSAAAQVVWHRDGFDGVVGRGPVLILHGVTATASYHAVATSPFGEVTTASAEVTVVAKPAGDSNLVVEQIAVAEPGHYVPAIAAHGTDVVWSEHFVNDYGDGGDALREWNAGYLGYVVAPEAQWSSSGGWGDGWSNFRPVLTADGLYYVAGVESFGNSYWEGTEEFRYRPVGGGTVVAMTESIGTFAGEDWDFHPFKSGRVVAPKQRWSATALRDVTGGTVSDICQIEAVSWESEWGTTYSHAWIERFPGAVAWVAGGDVDPETGDWSSTGLAVLRDGDDTPVCVDGAPHARLADVSDNAILWVEPASGGGEVLVVADANGGSREEVASAPMIVGPAFSGPSVFWQEYDGDGTVALKFRSSSGTIHSLDQVGAVVESAYDEVFRAVPYRGGVAWLHDTGTGTERDGGLEVRVWNGTETYVAASGVARPGVVSRVNAGPDGHWDEELDKFVASGWSATSYLGSASSVFARDMVTETRLVFERLADGVRSLCVWEGDAPGHSAAVVAAGYASEPFLALAVNDAGVAAAVNFGTSSEPQYRVFAAYEPEETPAIRDLPQGMEMTPYECDVAAALGVDHAAWSMFLGDGDFSLSPAGVLSGKTATAGERVFRVLSRDGDGVESIVGVRVVIAENPDRPPVVDSATPEPGYANYGSGTTLAFSVTAHDPEGAALSYRWFVDGAEMEADGAVFQLAREAGDVSAHNVRCEIADATWNEGNVAVEWNVGVLAVVSAEGTPIHTGGTSWLSVTLASSVGFYASGGMAPGFDATTWFDAATGEQIGNGNSVKAPATGSGSYYAVITTAYGTVQTDVVTVEIDPSPAVARIYKRSGGPAVVGNRCVLHAAVNGEKPLEAVWTRDGEAVGTGDTLDIASLSKDDFGSYVLTVRNASGTASSEPFALSPAPSGTLVGWAQDGSAGSVPQERIDGAVQVAASSYGGVAMRLDGTVVAWSDNSEENGLADVPDGLSGVAQVAAARGWNSRTGVAAALRRDGSIIVWGNADDGFPTSLPDLGDVVQIALGSQCLVALRSDGTVAVVRMSSVHENGTWIDRVFISEICEAGDAVGVFAQGYSDHAVLHDDGTLSDDFDADGHVELVSVGGQFYDWGCWIALGADGRAKSNWHGRWNDTVVEALDDVIAVDAQYSYGLAALLTSDGRVHLVGGADETPPDGTHAFAISSGAAHTLALVADPDVNPDDSEMLSFLDDYGVVANADRAPAIEVLRAAGADCDGDGQTTWAEYVAGTDPTDDTKKFQAEVVFENGIPHVRFDPDLGEAREYVIESVSELGGGWSATDNDEVGADADAPAKFFRVKVALPSGK